MRLLFVFGFLTCGKSISIDSGNFCHDKENGVYSDVENEYKLVKCIQNQMVEITSFSDKLLYIQATSHEAMSQIQDACLKENKNIFQCIKDNIKYILAPLTNKIMESNGIRPVSSVKDAKEMIDSVNNVLIWFCLEQPDAQFCRYIINSGSKLSNIEDKQNVINESNRKLKAYKALIGGGFFSTYNSKNITDCEKTKLLIQLMPSKVDQINRIDQYHYIGLGVRNNLKII